MVSHLNSFRYVELDDEFIETPFQHFEEVSCEVAAGNTMVEVPIVPKHASRMASLKDAEVVIKEGKSTIWGKLLDFPIRRTSLG